MAQVFHSPLQDRRQHLSLGNKPWVFVMAGKSELASLLRHMATAKRPPLVLLVAAELVENMDASGRVGFTRLELAARLKVHHTKVSLALKQLEGWGAITREHDRRRDACATIFVSANLATMLGDGPRQRRQARDPKVSTAPLVAA